MGLFFLRVWMGAWFVLVFIPNIFLSIYDNQVRLSWAMSFVVFTGFCFVLNFIASYTFLCVFVSTLYYYIYTSISLLLFSKEFFSQANYPFVIFLQLCSKPVGITNSYFTILATFLRIASIFLKTDGV